MKQIIGQQSKWSLILLVFVIGSLAANAQEGNVAATLVGKVVDNSGNPVAYTNIGLEGTYYGTASNAEGEFELKIPEEFKEYQIFFSAVGFKNKTLPVSQLFGKEFALVRLEAQSYSIDDIDINAQSKVLLRILRTASENIHKNFQDGLFTMVCDYSWKKIAEGKSKKRDATVEITDKNGYEAPSKLDAYQNRNYRFSNVKKNFESYSLYDGNTNLDELLNLDFARSASSILNPSLLNSYILSMEEEPTYKGVSTWLVGFKQLAPTFEGTGDFYANQFEGKIYINKNNYAVMRIECWVSAPKQNQLGRGLAISADNNNFITDVAYDFSVNYNNKGVEDLSLNKTYKKDGVEIKESTKLIVKSAIAENNTITSRDYFEGK